MFNIFDELQIGMAAREMQEPRARSNLAGILERDPDLSKEIAHRAGIFRRVSCSCVQIIRYQRPDTPGALDFFDLLNKTVLCYNGCTGP